MVVTMIEENHERVLLVVNLVGNVDLWSMQHTYTLPTITSRTKLTKRIF